jgi:hypothetical protein
VIGGITITHPAVIGTATAIIIGLFAHEVITISAAASDLSSGHFADLERPQSRMAGARTPGACHSSDPFSRSNGVRPCLQGHSSKLSS